MTDEELMKPRAEMSRLELYQKIDELQRALIEALAARPPVEAGELVTLAECPIGLFMYGEELCLKTEYGSNEGRIDAYIASSGEFFWGGTSTPAEQRKVLVRPVSIEHLSRQKVGGERTDNIRRLLDWPLKGYASEFDAQKRGWRSDYAAGDDACLCPTCATLSESRVRAALESHDE